MLHFISVGYNFEIFKSYMYHIVLRLYLYQKKLGANLEDQENKNVRINMGLKNKKYRCERKNRIQN